jgi:hypothetical protein
VRLDYKREEMRDGRMKLVSVPVKVQVQNYIDELIIGRCVDRFSFESGEKKPIHPDLRTTEFSLVLQRHRFVRATALILYSVAFVFLFYIARREETSKVLTNSLGYIAALWGIRQIIVGYAKLFPTLVDFITLALYVIVIAIVAYRWTFSAEQTPPDAGVGGSDGGGGPSLGKDPVDTRAIPQDDSESKVKQG